MSMDDGVWYQTKERCSGRTAYELGLPDDSYNYRYVMKNENLYYVYDDDRDTFTIQNYYSFGSSDSTKEYKFNYGLKREYLFKCIFSKKIEYIL